MSGVPRGQSSGHKTPACHEVRTSVRLEYTFDRMAFATPPRMGTASSPFRQWSRPKHTTGSLAGAYIPDPTSEDEFLNVAHKMVCGALERVTKEDQKQIKTSGKADERMTWAYVTTQMMGIKVGEDAYRLLKAQPGEEIYSTEEWEGMPPLRNYFITELDRQLFATVLNRGGGGPSPNT